MPVKLYDHNGWVATVDAADGPHAIIHNAQAFLRQPIADHHRYVRAAGDAAQQAHAIDNLTTAHDLHVVVDPPVLDDLAKAAERSKAAETAEPPADTAAET